MWWGGRIGKACAEAMLEKLRKTSVTSLAGYECTRASSPVLLLTDYSVNGLRRRSRSALSQCLASTFALRLLATAEPMSSTSNKKLAAAYRSRAGDPAIWRHPLTKSAMKRCSCMLRKYLP